MRGLCGQVEHVLVIPMGFRSPLMISTNGAQMSELGFCPDGLSESAYRVAKTKLDRAFEARKQQIPALLDQEGHILIERERNLRKLSLAESLIREQDAVLRVYLDCKRGGEANDIRTGCAKCSCLAHLPGCDPGLCLA